MKNASLKVVTRFAPSPTGLFHVGGIRSALYNFLFARQHKGTFILRCDDTDKERSRKEYENYFLEVFKWLSLSYDEYYRQSERTEIYKKYLEKMIADGTAYISKEVPKEEGDKEEVIRFKNPNKKISFDDVVLGRIEFDTKDLGDFIIARDLESPLYHFATVVDDYEMKITHVIRGQEHVSNTPRQILMQEAIGAPQPIYAHASIILDKDRKKLSKRDPKVLPVLEYKSMGYLPEAILNFMAFIGWNPGTEQEIFTLDNLIGSFSLEKLQKPGAIFNSEKLDWVNKEHIKLLPKVKLLEHINSAIPEKIRNLPEWGEERLAKIIPILIERIVKFSDITQMAEAGEIDFFFQAPEYDAVNLIWKKDIDGGVIRAEIGNLIETIEKIPEESFTEAGIKEAILSFIGDKDRGSILWPMRYALSGIDKSPDPFTIASILGKNETVSRLKSAKKKLHLN
ncbi:MAG: glutamate--tRNA ligase [Candidatus Paceibacterota bacterium]|jgi:glutamyl-tRNA synthetase